MIISHGGVKDVVIPSVIRRPARDGNPVPPFPPLFWFPTRATPPQHLLTTNTMSKATLGLIAAVSATAGVACTALFYSATGGSPPRATTGTTWKPTSTGPVDPAGLFQYGNINHLPPSAPLLNP